jgi:hypothetical protein
MQKKIPILTVLLEPKNPLFRELHPKLGYGYSQVSRWVRKSSVGMTDKRFQSKMAAWEKYVKKLYI